MDEKRKVARVAVDWKVSLRLGRQVAHGRVVEFSEYGMLAVPPTWPRRASDTNWRLRYPATETNFGCVALWLTPAQKEWASGLNLCLRKSPPLSAITWPAPAHPKVLLDPVHRCVARADRTLGSKRKSSSRAEISGFPTFQTHQPGLLESWVRPATTRPGKSCATAALIRRAGKRGCRASLNP